MTFDYEPLEREDCGTEYDRRLRWWEIAFYILVGELVIATGVLLSWPLLRNAGQ